MEIKVTKIGRPALTEATDIATLYEKKIKPFAKIEVSILKDNNALKKWFERESKNVYLIVLDETGKEFTSIVMAEKMRGLVEKNKKVVFLIGDPYGIPEEILAAGQEKWCLSKMTLTSDMSLMLLMEQLYRGFQIQKGTGYHHV